MNSDSFRSAIGLSGVSTIRERSGGPSTYCCRRSKRPESCVRTSRAAYSTRLLSGTCGECLPSGDERDRLDCDNRTTIPLPCPPSQWFRIYTLGIEASRKPRLGHEVSVVASEGKHRFCTRIDSSFVIVSCRCLLGSFNGGNCAAAQVPDLPVHCLPYGVASHHRTQVRGRFHNTVRQEAHGSYQSGW